MLAKKFEINNETAVNFYYPKIIVTDNSVICTIYINQLMIGIIGKKGSKTKKFYNSQVISILIID